MPDPFRLVCLGRSGQVALSLQEKAGAGLTVIALGRPELDLAGPPDAIRTAIAQARPHAVVNAAAHTAVDQAESDEDAAFAVNAAGAGAAASACAALGLPFVHLSTDYVYSGDKPAPYIETDPTGPTGAYARTKLAGEARVLAAHPDAVVMRTAWVYSPFGKNFVRTMLRLAEGRDTVTVVADQVGCPTYAPDIAEACIAVARALGAEPKGRGGVYHYAGAGETNWAGFARAIFDGAATRGLPSATVADIPTSAYPTPAKRPANSRLDCAKIEAAFGVAPKPWRDSLSVCLDRLAAG